MASATGEFRKLALRADGGPCEFDWQTQFKRTIFQGWRQLSGNTADLDEPEVAEAAEAGDRTLETGIAASERRQAKLDISEANPYETGACDEVY
jgi:hypothetical protein